MNTRRRGTRPKRRAALINGRVCVPRHVVCASRRSCCSLGEYPSTHSAYFNDAGPHEYVFSCGDNHIISCILVVGGHGGPPPRRSASPFPRRAAPRHMGPLRTQQQELLLLRLPRL